MIRTDEKMNREKFAQSKVVNAIKRFALEANDDSQIGIPQRKFSVDSILIKIIILHYSISHAIASFKPSNSDQFSESNDLSMNDKCKNKSVRMQRYRNIIAIEKHSARFCFSSSNDFKYE